MKISSSTTGKTSQEDSGEFSLVSGGPLHQLWHRIGPGRRIGLVVALTWVPLLVLSIVAGQAWGDGVTLPFLKDIESHARLLLAVPLLIAAEPFVNGRIHLLVRQFGDRGLITDETRRQFDSAVAAAMRLRDSTAAEVLLLAFVYGVGLMVIWRSRALLDVTTWYGLPVNGRLQPSLAGWWFGYLSLPVFQFLLLRWFFRLFIWARFLWQVSRIQLQILATHPDRCGGLGFLAGVGNTFKPLVTAQGMLLAGMIANRIFYAGATILEYKIELAAVVAIMLLMILGPLLAFSSGLEKARRRGVREYGGLAARYMREFDQKWVRGSAQPGESLMGSADIQSLADMSNSFSVVKEMTILPFSAKTISGLAIATLVPVAPLVLTMIPLEKLIEHLLKLLI